MLEQIIVTRVKQKMATLSEWQTVWQTFKPLKGEQCIVVIPANSTEGEALGFPKSENIRHVSKTGDGESFLGNLPWDNDITNVSNSIQDNKQELTRIAALVGEETVATQITNAFSERFFVGTTAEYESAREQGLVTDGMIVFLTDDDATISGDNDNPPNADGSTSAVLGLAVLGQMILG